MTIRIKARFSGLIAASLGCKEMYVEAPDGASIKQIIEQLAIPVQLSWTVTSINGVVKDKSTVLMDGDVLHIFPAGGGG